MAKTSLAINNLETWNTWANASADSSYLNELYRSRAEKAGNGFVDGSGKFSPQGPDYLGQTRRLRTPDGVYFTKFGARKLAHYVEHEIERVLKTQNVPVALPVPVDQKPKAAKGKPNDSVRPDAGPVIALTDASVPSEELLG